MSLKSQVPFFVVIGLIAGGLPLASPSQTSASVGDSSVTRLSLKGVAQITGDSRRPSYSSQATGGSGDHQKQWIAFDTSGTNAVSNDAEDVKLTGFSADTNAKRDVVIRDRTTGAPTRIVSVDLQSGQRFADSWNPAVSGTGRFVAFLSNGTFGDGNGEGNERPCDNPSPDESAAGQGNEARDLNGVMTDVYVRDRDADSKLNIVGSVDMFDQKFLPGQVAGSLPYCGTKTALVSVGTDELQANKPGGYKSVQDGSLGISDDGRFVVFATTAQVVTTDSAGAVRSVDTDALLDVYVRDRDTDGDKIFDERDAASTYLISQATANTVAAGFPTISADGRSIAYEDGSNIRIVRLSVLTGRPTVTTVVAFGTVVGSRPAIGVAAGATAGVIAYQRSGIVYTRSLPTPATGLSTIGTERSFGEGTLPQLDRAGKTVAFSRSIVGGVQSVRAGLTSVGGSRLISRTAASVNGNAASGAQTVFPEVAVLDDAVTSTAFVAFSSDADDLISGANNQDGNGKRDVFENRWTPVVISVSTSVTPTVPAARGVRLTDVPATALTFDKGLLATVVGAPAGAVRSLPSGGVRSLPSGGVRSLPGGGVRSLQLQGLPLGGIRSLPGGGLRSLPSGTVRSLDVALSQLALNISVANVSYTWTELLVGSPYAGWPLQSVTMRDLLDYIDVIKTQSVRTPAQTLLLNLTLFDIDPQGSFLQGVSLVSIFLGDYTLAELSAAAGTNTIPWCATLPSTIAAGVRDALCAQTSTLFALDLGGADLSQINLDLIDASRLTPAKSGGALEALVQTYGPIASGTGLGTYIMRFLDARDFPWENVALTLPGALNLTYPGSGGATLEPHARGGLATWVSTVNTPEVAPVVVKFSLPAGFAYAPGTAGCGATCTPTVTTSTTGGVSQVTVAFASAVGANPVTVGARPTPLLLGATISAASLPTINEQSVGGVARVEVSYDGDAAYDSSGVANAVAPVTVFDPWGSGQRALEPGTLYFADIAGTSEEDEYTIALPAGTPAGTKLSVRLSSLTSDLDLTVFVKDPSAPESLPGGAIRSLPGGAVRSLPGGAVRSLPGGAIRSLNGYVRSLPLEDVGDDRTSSLPPEVLQDIPQSPPQSLPGGYVRALSPNRDTRPETIDTVVGTGAGTSPLLYTVRVTGYNDALGPYALRVITDPPVNPSPAQCNAVGDAANLSISTLPATATTLILYPRAAIAAKYSATDAAALNEKVSALAAFEASQGRPASIAEVTYSAGFDWTTDDPCSPVRANAVATSINDELIELGLPSGSSVPPLQYVVIIGGDDVLPMARVADTTEVSNEVDYANSFGRSNPLARSAAAGRVLTDNIYGDFNPGTIGDSALLVPELAVGRLVETPTQISTQIDAFIGSGGRLVAGTQSVAAYDFLLDSGAAIASNLGSTNTSLINDSWNRSALLTALGANPKVISLNAHFDHQGLLTAAGNGGLTAGGFPDQVGLDDVQALRTALVFSVGCHSGLNVPRTYDTGGGLRFRDWADELSDQSALFVANTGFGYGDTQAIALSEQLMTSFSGLIGTYTAGQALVAAKQDYAASLGSYVGYDEKVVHQSTMYGLPMYSLVPVVAASTQAGFSRDSSQALALTPAPANPDVVGATTTAGSTNSALQTASVVVTTGGTDAKGYPKVPAVTSPVTNGLTPDRQVSNGYPIVPRLQVDVTADGDLMARGALITSMRATAPQSQTALYARATVDLTSREAANTADDVFFPTTFQTINHVGGPGGGRDRLVLLPGQYRKGVTDSTGTMTSFTSMQASVFYGPAGTGDLTPPTIDSVVADKVEPPAGVTGNKAVVFRVTTSDQESGVWKVVVLYDLGGNWVAIELTPLAGVGVQNQWVGSLQTNEVDGPRFIVQVVNNDGRVGTATDKGRYYKVTGTRPTLVTVIRGVLGNNGWYVQGPAGAGSAVLAEIYGAPGATFTSTVTRTGSAAVGPENYNSLYPVELKDAANIKDGLFSVLATSGTGATLVTNVKVDATPPIISATVDGAALSIDISLPTEVIAFAPGLVALSCSDATSGIASSAITVFPGTKDTDSCSGNGTLNTGAPKGLRTITATATDVAGNVVTTSFYATIKDTGKPVVKITPETLSGNEATSGAGALVVVAVTVSGTDAIDGTLTVVCTKPNGTVVTPGSTQLFMLGVTTVTCTATDSSGNTGSGTFTVAVGDSIAPVVGVPGPLTVEATSTAGATVSFTATASDAVTLELVPTCTPASMSTFTIGTTKVTCSAKDGSGNTGTASFDVKVVDSVKPVLILDPGGNIVQEATGPGGAVVTYTVTASDTVSGVLAPLCSPSSGSTFPTFPIDTTTVTCSATDSALNTGSITFDVIVKDRIAPTLSLPLVPVVEAAAATGSIVTYAVTATDVVDPNVTVSCTPASGTTFAVGTTTVDCTATDYKRNQSSGSFTVRVFDRIAPSLTVPGNTTDEASSASGAVIFFVTSATDAVTATPTVTCTTVSGLTTRSVTSGSTFPMGSTTVTCSAVDGAGNTSGQQSFTVTVRDNTAPVLTVPSNITIGATSGAGSVVTFVATATDAVTAAPTVTCTPPSGSTFPIGTTTVTCTATDGSGNTSASQSFTVTVARPYRYSGFYSPVNMDEVTKPLGADGVATVVNSVNGGRNVPLKFEVFENGVEITDVRRIEIQKTKLGVANAPGCAGKKVIPLSSSTSKAVLKFDGSQFNEGWATPPIPSGQLAECWKVTVRVKTPLPGDSGPGITAFFLVTP